ncbi:MAG: hypothetical protein DRI57_32735 [Deltaproteobacteria bacterium]|nr:MAG: hypothetical protein DRI57_32735 [Deltaproteobacteria bacterium]
MVLARIILRRFRPALTLSEIRIARYFQTAGFDSMNARNPEKIVIPMTNISTPRFPYKYGL